MQAYVDGKTIEFFDITTGEWQETSQPVWDSAANYRIKPEHKYRPYNSTEEAFQEAKKHGFWVCDEEGNYRQICYIYDKGIEIANEYTYTYSFDDLFKSFVWHDTKTPCGILEK